MELIEFCKKKKIQLKDIVELLELLEVTEITLVGEEGVKIVIIDNLRDKDIEVNVKKRHRRLL